MLGNYNSQLSDISQLVFFANSMPQLVFIADGEGKLEFVNQKWIDYTGLDLENSIHCWSSVVDPTQLEELHSIFQRSLETGSMFEMEYKIRNTKGEYLWHLGRSIPMKDGDGKILKWFGTATDIDILKSSKEQLKETEARFRNIADEAPAFIFIAGENAEVEFFNQTWLDFTGMSYEEAKGRSWADVTHPDNVEMITREYTTAFQNKTAYTFEGQHRRKDGKYRWILWHGIPRFLPTNRFIGLMGWGIDITDRKVAEYALKEREDLFRNLADNIPNLAWMANKDGYIIWYNKRWFEFTGTTEDDMEGWGWQAVHHPEVLPEVMTSWTESIACGKEFEMTFPLKSADGTFRTFLTRVNPVKNASGEIEKWFGTNTDITDQKNAENAFKESEESFRKSQERLELAQAAAKIGTFEWLIRENIVIATVELEALYGVPPGAFSNGNQKWHESVHADDLVVVKENITKAIESREEFNVEFRVVWPDESIHWLLAKGKVIYDSTGLPLRILGVNIDISDRKQAEQALVLSESNYKAMANAMPIVVWTATPEGVVDYFNEKWCENTGVFIEQKDWTWKDVIYCDDLENFMQVWSKSIVEGKGYQLEYRWKKPCNGAYRWQLAHGMPIKNNRGEVIKWVGTGTDIHNQKLLYEELTEKNNVLTKANNDLDNFVYTASHDLKAPVMNLEGLSSALMDLLSQREGNEELALLEMMDTSMKRLKKTIQDLTEISKIQHDINKDSGHFTFQEMMDDAVINLREQIVKSRAEISTDFRINSVHFSKKNLRSIVYNLISNAIKYQKPQEKPRISIETYAEKNYIVLKVMDNGLGIEASQICKLFGIFKRLHDHVEGTGIGLYIVKRIIDNSGGKILVESKLNIGTTFSVYFKN